MSQKKKGNNVGHDARRASVESQSTQKSGSTSKESTTIDLMKTKSVSMKFETNLEVFKLIVPGLRCEFRGQSSQKGVIVKVIPNDTDIVSGSCQVHWNGQPAPSIYMYKFSNLCISFRVIDYDEAEKRKAKADAAAADGDDQSSNFQMVSI